MLKRDFFLRQIEQLTVVLHKILFHKEHKQMEEAQRLLSEACRHLLGLNLRSLQALPSKDILELLTYNGVTDTGKALVLADLFREQGDLFRDDEKPEEAYTYHKKSLDLLLQLFLQTAQEDREEMREDSASRIKECLERLDGLFLPGEIKQKLFSFYEQIGEYAKAEDVLFHYIEDDPDRETTVAEGILFYERLLDKEETDLEAGNFSSEEAAAGLSQLKEWRKS